jgi:hypothetical protein
MASPLPRRAEPPEDVEWEDGTVGAELPPDSVEWEDEAALPVEAATQAPADPGVLAAIRASFGQGGLKGGSDEVIGGLTRALGPSGVPGHTSADVYRRARDAEREVLRGAQEHYPVPSLLADLSGDLASDFLATRLGVPRVGSTPSNVAEGALSGYNRSEADLTEGRATPENHLAACTETAAGGAMGYVAPKVGEKVGKGLSGAGAWAGRKAGGMLSEGATSLEEGLRRFAQERALKAAGYIQKDFPRAAKKLERLRQSGQTLLDEPGLIRPGTSSATIADRLEPLVEREGASIGRYLDEADASAVAQDLAFTEGTFNPYPFLERARREIVQPALEDPSLRPQGRTLEGWLSRLRETDASLAGRGEPFTFRRANEVKGNLQDGIFNNRGDVKTNKGLANQLQRQMIDAIDEQATPLLGREGVEGFQAARSKYGTFKEALDKSTQGANRETGNNFLRIDDRQAAEAGAMVAGAPGAAVAGGASKLLRGRGDSVAAVGADRLVKSGALGRLPGPEALAAAGAVAGAAGGRVVQTALSTTDWLNMATEQNPEALGPYAETLAQAKADGRLAMVHYMLEQKDPQYREMLASARAGGVQ